MCDFRLTITCLDAEGWVDVNEETLQCRAYKNVFGLGDCVGTQNDKTAAAVSAQFSVVRHNLENVSNSTMFEIFVSLQMMNDKEFEYKYNGYSAHPFLVDSKHGMLAEFNSDGDQMETLPLNQSKPGYLYSYIDRYLLPFLYWKVHMRGFWQGPETLRKIFHLGMSK
jgi:sulfide:quinone oxidoreductase